MNCANELGVSFFYNQEVISIEQSKRYLVHTTHQTYQADYVIFAMGSEAGKLSGVNNSRYDILKKLKLDVTLATIFIVILLAQGIELFQLRNYEIPVLTNSIVEMDLNTVLKNIENKDCTVLQLEYKEGWIGKVLFTGSLEDLSNYVNLLKNNNINIKNYKIEKSEELRCFLELKVV